MTSGLASVADRAGALYTRIDEALRGKNEMDREALEVANRGRDKPSGEAPHQFGGKEEEWNSLWFIIETHDGAMFREAQKSCRA